MFRVLFRHDWLRQGVAVWLLLLVLSPCTAPFATLDVLRPATAAALDAPKTKTSGDELVVASAPAVFLHVESRMTDPRGPRMLAGRRLASQHAILRL